MREKGCGHPLHVSCWRQVFQTKEFLSQESPEEYKNQLHTDRPDISNVNIKSFKRTWLHVLQLDVDTGGWLLLDY